MDPGNIHLTCAFLGGTAQSKLPAIKKSMDETAAAFRKIPVILGGFGGFPSLERPRVLWLGFKGGGDALKVIAMSLCGSLTAEGFIFEHEFSAHITIARVPPALLVPDAGVRAVPETGKRSSRCRKSGVKPFIDSAALASMAAKTEEPDACGIVPGIELIESMLTSAGPVYRALYSKEFL